MRLYPPEREGGPPKAIVYSPDSYNDVHVEAERRREQKKNTIGIMGFAFFFSVLIVSGFIWGIEGVIVGFILMLIVGKILDIVF